MAIVCDADWRKYHSGLESASGEWKRIRSGSSKQKSERSQSESHSDSIVIEPISAKNHLEIYAFAGVSDIAVQSTRVVADLRGDTP